MTLTESVVWSEVRASSDRCVPARSCGSRVRPAVTRSETRSSRRERMTSDRGCGCASKRERCASRRVSGKAANDFPGRGTDREVSGGRPGHVVGCGCCRPRGRVSANARCGHRCWDWSGGRRDKVVPNKRFMSVESKSDHGRRHRYLLSTQAVAATVSITSVSGDISLLKTELIVPHRV
jgi:hypothetical protein